MIRSRNLKRIIGGCLVLGSGPIGLLLLTAPNHWTASWLDYREARLYGGLLLVGGLISALCGWATAAQPPTSTASAHRRWQMLPWLPLVPAGLCVVAFLMLHQLTFDMAGSVRNKVLMPIVVLFVVTWSAAAGTAVISLLRGLVLKARGQVPGGIASSLCAAVLCGLSAPVWLMAVVLSLQAGTPP